MMSQTPSQPSSIPTADEKNDLNILRTLRLGRHEPLRYLSYNTFTAFS